MLLPSVFVLLEGVRNIMCLKLRSNWGTGNKKNAWACFMFMAVIYPYAISCIFSGFGVSSRSKDQGTASLKEPWHTRGWKWPHSPQLSSWACCAPQSQSSLYWFQTYLYILWYVVFLAVSVDCECFPLMDIALEILCMRKGGYGLIFS